MKKDQIKFNKNILTFLISDRGLRITSLKKR